MGANTIIMMNHTSVDNSVRGVEHNPLLVNRIARLVMDQILWLSALVLLADMAVKNKKRRMTAWWAAK